MGENQCRKKREAFECKLLDQVEGYRKKMYLPKYPDGTVIGKSGPSISRGLDLGQWRTAGLKRMGLSSELIELFRPYTLDNKALYAPSKSEGESENSERLDRSDRLKKFLKENPLEISDEQAREVADLACRFFIDRVRRDYNLENPQYEYDQLPQEIRAVFLSIAYQYGATGEPTKKVKGIVRSGNYSDLHQWLTSRPDYKHRRKTEANVLMEMLDRDAQRQATQLDAQQTMEDMNSMYGACVGKEFKSHEAKEKLEILDQDLTFLAEQIEVKRAEKAKLEEELEKAAEAHQKVVAAKNKNDAEDKLEAVMRLQKQLQALEKELAQMERDRERLVEKILAIEEELLSFDIQI